MQTAGSPDFSTFAFVPVAASHLPVCPSGSVAPLKTRARDQTHQHMLEAAVYDNFLAVHEPRAAACEEYHPRGHVLGGADAPERDCRRSTLKHLWVLIERFAHRRAHE